MKGTLVTYKEKIVKIFSMTLTRKNKARLSFVPWCYGYSILRRFALCIQCILPVFYHRKNKLVGKFLGTATQEWWHWHLENENSCYSSYEAIWTYQLDAIPLCMISFSRELSWSTATNHVFTSVNVASSRRSVTALVHALHYPRGLSEATVCH